MKPEHIKLVERMLGMVYTDNREPYKNCFISHAGDVRSEVTFENLIAAIEAEKDAEHRKTVNSLADHVCNHNKYYRETNELISSLNAEIANLKQSRTEYMDICEQLSGQLAEARAEIERLSRDYEITHYQWDKVTEENAELKAKIERFKK